MKWPNNKSWSALSNTLVAVDNGEYLLSTIDCGKLKVPSGNLVCCDPFACMEKTGNSFVKIPSGEYQVVVTLADVSQAHDGSHVREAYASLILSDAADEVTRKCLQPTADGIPTSERLEDGEFFGFGVDAGTACFVDAESLQEGMPDSDDWYEELFENEDDNCWFNVMDNPEHIRDGIANIELPESSCNNNLILFHSGWGDGFYPVVGGFDANNNLVAVHIDFFVASNPEE